jgi:hypothetical protein
MEPPYRVFGERFRGLGSVKGLARTAFATLGSSGKATEAWWYGQRRPGLAVLSALAELLEVDVRYLHGEVPTPLDSLTFRQVAARESLRIFLASETTLSTAERQLLEEATDSPAARVTVAEWRALCQHFIKPAVALGEAQGAATTRMIRQGRRAGEGRRAKG